MLFSDLAGQKHDMDEEPPLPARVHPPAHLWVVGIVLVLWNAWGLAIALAAQSGQFLDQAPPEAAAYFAAQPTWFVLIADIGPIAGVAGAVALLLQHRSAPWLFALQLAVLVLSNGYEVATGTSFMLAEPDAVPGTLVLLTIIAAQIFYAWYLRSKGVLY